MEARNGTKMHRWVVGTSRGVLLHRKRMDTAYTITCIVRESSADGVEENCSEKYMKCKGNHFTQNTDPPSVLLAAMGL